MLYTKIQPQSCLGSGEEVFMFYFLLRYTGKVAILFSGAKPFEQTYEYFRQKAPCEIW